MTEVCYFYRRATAAKATVTKQKDEIAMYKKELKLQRKTIAVYEDRLSKVLAHETCAEPPCSPDCKNV